MKFAINGNPNDIREIVMKAWDDGSGYGPDIFDDMETDFPRTHRVAEEIEEETGIYAYLCTEDEYTELLAWWEQYCEDANNHSVCDNGDDYTEHEGPELHVWES